MNMLRRREAVPGQNMPAGLFLAMIMLLAAGGSAAASSWNDTMKPGTTGSKTDTYQPGPDWNLVWSDEFAAATIDPENWNFQVVEAGRFNEEWQRYTSSSDNAYIEDGCLVIRANHESDVHGLDQYTSARLNTANRQAFRYGKIAARIKLPHGKGIWPAFWMLGANIDENGGVTPWPQSGEIDIMELYGSNDDGVVEANAHYADESGAHANMGAAAYALQQGKFADAFHVFELEWDADKIAWFVDGEKFASMPTSADGQSAFHKEFFLLLNIAVGGTHAGRPDSSTDFPQSMYVDWVRVYQKG
jgi:beta-glucanase (GH16 family)